MNPMPPPLPQRPAIKDILAGDPTAGDGKGGTTEKQVADLLAPLAGVSGGLLLISMKAGEALGGKFNLKTAKTTEHLFRQGYVPVVRAMALALGSLKNEITAAFDTPAGAVVEARMNADFLSLGGLMLFQIQEISPVDVKVIAQAEIKGQMFDWGKSERALKQVIDKANHFLSFLVP
jgi:hypothetical protein